MTRMSGVNIGERMIRKGSADAIRRYIEANHGKFPVSRSTGRKSCSFGRNPLVVVDNQTVLGVVALKDIVKLE